MREFIGLFRGKRLCNGKWMTGDLLRHPDGTCFICHTGYRLNKYKVDPTTIGECTGLKDKNGKLIWEGDIVRICDRGRCAEGIIVFENAYPGGWLVADMFYKHKCSLAMRTDVEIIGNVTDNPELLEGGEG